MSRTTHTTVDHRPMFDTLENRRLLSVSAPSDPGGTDDTATAATMTAIAMAESGGRTSSHRAGGDDSRGLWQINVDSGTR